MICREIVVIGDTQRIHSSSEVVMLILTGVKFGPFNNLFQTDCLAQANFTFLRGVDTEFR